MVRQSILTVIIASIVTVNLINNNNLWKVQAQSKDTPFVVLAVAPVFPYTVVAANISGFVIIEVKVDVQGNVVDTKIVEGHPLLRQVQSLEKTARRWRFNPSDNSKKLRTARLKFIFSIMPKETIAEELSPIFSIPYQVEVKHVPYLPVVHSDPPTKENLKN